GISDRTLHDLLQWVKCSCWLFDGITERTMIRGEGWHFLRCGKFLERAEATARLLGGKSYAAATEATVAAAVDLHQCRALLRSVGADEAFRKSHRSFTPAPILAYLILDGRFPGTIRYSLARVEEALRSISSTDGAENGNEAERCSGRLLSTLVHARG